MRKRYSFALAVFLVFMLVAVTGGIVIKDNPGKHKGHYKQSEKSLKKIK